MIYVVTYFNGEKWIEFISFTVEKYAVNFMDKMKNEYPDLNIIIKSKIPNAYELAFSFSTDISENTTF